MLKDNVERAKKRVNVIFTLRLGSTAEGITKVANDESVDFIIIGSTGLSSENKQTNKKSWAVLQDVFQNWQSPVMIVK